MSEPFATFRIGQETCSLYWSSLSHLTGPESSRMVVTDSRVAGLYRLEDSGAVILPPGEKHKTWESVQTILRGALERNLDRTSTFAGVGGGVVCDMTAFAASLYMRGTGLVLYPTTLLAMVDASLGGKTGIDFEGFKNSVGTFYPARELHIDPTVIGTLSDTDFRCGLAEVIKSGVIGDEELLTLIERERDRIFAREPGLMRELIERSLRVKGRIVEEDFTEKGIRVWLNLGHTFGHALETVTNFAVGHGEAVAWGMDRAMALGEQLGLTDPGYRKRIRALLKDCGYRLEIPVPDMDAYTAAFQKDKKKAGTDIRFIIPERTGVLHVRKVPVDEGFRVMVNG